MKQVTRLNMVTVKKSKQYSDLMREQQQNITEMAVKTENLLTTMIMKQEELVKDGEN